MNSAVKQSPALTIPLPQKERERLTRLAVRYGLSLPAIATRILQEVTDEFSEESLDEYEHPDRVRASYQRAIRDFHAGRVSTEL